MTPETWLVLTVAAAFLLLGVAGSPLAWALLHHRRSRAEELVDRRWRSLTDQVRALDNRLNQFETIRPSDAGLRGIDRSDSRGALRDDPTHEPALIAVPNLEGASGDRNDAKTALKERHAAIWALADAGAAPEVIARATGQPLGHIELVLGLRRQVDGARTILSHAPHA